MFAPGAAAEAPGAAARAPGAAARAPAAGPGARRGGAPDYSVSPSGVFDHIAAFLTGFAAGFAVLFVFYKIFALSIVGGVLTGTVWIFVSSNNAINKRKRRLRIQFFDLLEALSVSMRAGSPVAKALQSARADLLLIYPENSDIMMELDAIIGKFMNTIPLSEGFADFAGRSGLDDIASFASIYATIEGKSSRADEIVRETQQIIADKMEIEMEIETLMTAAKSEVNIMLFMPLVILAVIGYAGAGFMDAIYTTTVGQLVATGGLIVFIISYIMAQKFSSVKL
jgi:tight adherence protein B